MWDLWWTKWHWDRFFPEYIVFPLSVSLIIYSTGLHNMPEGFGASVASYAGPFTKRRGGLFINPNKS
jgi:hypothetical protein